MKETLTDQKLIQALPQSFDFYELGQVQSLLSEPEELPLDATGIAYRFSGDCTAWLILLFESSLDASLYSEVGNVLASQTANQLAKSEGLGIMTSPPIFLNEAQVFSIRRRVQGRIIQRTYGHFMKGSVIPIHLMLFSNLAEETGNA